MEPKPKCGNLHECQGSWRAYMLKQSEHPRLYLAVPQVHHRPEETHIYHQSSTKA